MQNDLGKLTRHYFRLLAGRDAAEDGPEVDIIRIEQEVLRQNLISDWGACSRASNRIADLVSAVYAPNVRAMMPTATWAEIIASELGIDYTDLYE